jgi:2-methylisocitrate lyase-like PEP mutase family enzyme
MPTSPAHAFHALHQGPQLLRLPTVWDPASAALAQAAGAAALATSSAAVSWSLGYADGGHLPLAELLGAVQRLLRGARVPLSVDLEDGYSAEPEAVAALCVRLVELGVAGVNLEDGGHAPALLEAKLQAVRARLPREQLFLNARTDVFLAGLADPARREAETLARLQRYAMAGADGGFVPGLAELPVAARLAQACPLPLNLMQVPGLPDAAALQAAGVRRLSGGPALFLQAHGALQSGLNTWLGCAPGAALSYTAMNALFSNQP